MDCHGSAAIQGNFRYDIMQRKQDTNDDRFHRIQIEATKSKRDQAHSISERNNNPEPKVKRESGGGIGSEVEKAKEPGIL